jgi:hypothetical protein
MKTINPEKTFEFVVETVSTYTIQGNGRTKFEAEQDANARYHRLNKSRELVPDNVSKPKIVNCVTRK